MTRFPTMHPFVRTFLIYRNQSREMTTLNRMMLTVCLLLSGATTGLAIYAMMRLQLAIVPT